MSTRYRRDSSIFSPSRMGRSNLGASPPPSDSFDYNHVPGTSKSAGLIDTVAYAIETGDTDSVARILLVDEEGEDINVNQVVPGYSMSLMHLAVGFSRNDPLLVKIICERGGDPNNTKIDERISPMHLSVYHDFDRVLKVLIDYGGDPKIRNGEGQTCYDIVRQNVEEEMMENCFSYFFVKSRVFRKSMGFGLSKASAVGRRQVTVHDSGSDGFYSCESQMLQDTQSNDHLDSQFGVHSLARKLFPKEYSYLMTEDESEVTNSEDEEDFGRKLTTIKEESESCPTLKYSPLPTKTPSPALPSWKGRGIGSMTAPLYVLTDDSYSITSDMSMSCVNSTPPITPQPSKDELAKLQEQMKKLKIPITPSTYGVVSKFAESDSKLQILLTPKTGSCNFSPELQAGIENLNLIHEWGKHKIDFLQNITPTTKTSKSFYNYLLLDPKIIKRANFSGDHLKAGVINNNEKFEQFLLSVFYIGKAHGKRPLQHLVEAKAKYVEMGKKPLKNGEKIDKILKIWRSGMAVIIVSVFHHSSEREANVNEACMIDAMGLVELSNLMKGSYSGTVAAGWSQKIKNQLGSLLLHKSFCSFVVSDPKQFYPHDIS